MKHIMDRLAPALSRSAGADGSACSNHFDFVRTDAACAQSGAGRDESRLSIRADAARRDEASALQAGPNERRSEPRRHMKADVILTPLDDVSKHLRGVLLDISARGVRVRLDRSAGQPGPRQVYRIETRTNRMLCEVRNSSVVPASVEVGFEIMSSFREPK